MPVLLHVHSWYSLLEGVSSPEVLLERAAALGYSSLALTDTNNLYGAVSFTEAAPRYGVRPLLGACLRHQDQHCVVLVADPAGYRNLCRILSRLHLGLGRPFQLTELLVECAEGLHVLADDPSLAEQLHEAFGSRLWLEVIRPSRCHRQEQELLSQGKRRGLRPVASTAVHFASAEDYPVFRLVSAVRQTTLLERISPQLKITPGHNLIDPATLHSRFRDLPEAVYNTQALAEQLRSDVLPRDLVLPQRHLRPGLHEEDYLRGLCERGLRRRDLGDSLSARQRLRQELAIIEKAGLAGYFLVVRTIARHARRRGHSMALRGSAGNSLVCFLLEITDVNPLRFGLALERFLHSGRRDLPDIDLDFDWKVRDDVLAYARGRFGPAYTAQISTHLFLQARSAFREASKVHGLSDPQVSRLIESLSQRIGPIVEAREREVFPRGFPLEPERWPKIVADARRLLGRPHHLSIHPGGIVLTPRPIEEYVPLQMAPKGVVITQYEKDAVEHIGLVKIDLLGNRALSTVDEAQRWARSRSDKGVIGPTHPLRGLKACHTTNGDSGNHPDPETLALLRSGATLGVNQLESPAMRHLLVQIQPSGLEDIIRCLALIRPGAGSAGMKGLFLRRRLGLEPVDVYPLLEPLLRENYGLMVYEDDALHVVQALTGLPAPDADRLRKLAAREHSEVEAHRLCQEFVSLCVRRGVPRTVAEEQWRLLGRFRLYTFCKSHAVSYGLIAWQAAFLKAHHPAPFWTAALNNNQGVYPRWVYIEAIKRAGIPVRRPCVNHSCGPFTCEGHAIRTGLEAIASLEDQFGSALLTDRERRGPYRDLADLRRRLQPGPETLALLIGTGALDFTGRSRPALFLEADLEDRIFGKKGLGNGGEKSELFPVFSPGETWAPADYDARRRCQDEWRLMGFVVEQPLLSLFRSQLPHPVVGSRALPERVGRTVQVTGLMATASHALTTDGRPMQFLTLEDGEGLIEVALFPDLCPPIPYLSLGPYLVQGMVEAHHGAVTVAARSVEHVLNPIEGELPPVRVSGPGRTG